MNIVESEKNNITILSVSGRMDATTAPQFNEACQNVLSSGKKSVIVDLGGLEYISSAGLRSILVMGKSCKSAQANLAFCSMQNMVADMFKLSGFISILKVYPSQDEALNALA